MDELAQRAEQYIRSLSGIRMGDKISIQNVLLERKIENLRERRKSYAPIERTAIRLLSRVDYTNISPAFVWVAPKDLALWKYYRDTLSSAPFDGRPGRCTWGFVIDNNTGGVMGIFEIGSDMSVLGPRDRHIGWKHEDRFKYGMLRYVVNLGTCVCSQPFGWLTGGKLIASAIISREVFNLWQSRYGDALAAGVTTSLYGKSSQYERLREWSYLGETNGSIGIAHLTNEGVAVLSSFVKHNVKPNPYGRASRTAAGAGGGLPSKLNYFINACKLLGLSPEDYSAQQPRGVYFAEFGPLARPFLRRDVDEFMPEVETIQNKIAFWLDRWYKMRLPKKVDEIKTFDYNWYSIDNQISYIRERIASGPSVEGDTLPQAESQVRSLGAAPNLYCGETVEDAT